MLKLLFVILSWFTTGEEKELARSHYSKTTITDRYYFSGTGGQLADNRFYIDKTIRGNATLFMFHFEGWFGGLGYPQGIYWGTVGGKRVFFCYDHADYRYHDYPIQRGK